MLPSAEVLAYLVFIKRIFLHILGWYMHDTTGVAVSVQNSFQCTFPRRVVAANSPATSGHDSGKVASSSPPMNDGMDFGATYLRKVVEGSASAIHTIFSFAPASIIGLTAVYAARIEVG